MTTQTVSGFQGLPRTAALGTLIDFCNRLLIGRLNVVLKVTLTASAGTTTVTDPRIGPQSHISLACPLTAHAAEEIAAGGFYVSAQTKGSATLTHANNAQTDRTFNFAIFG